MHSSDDEGLAGESDGKQDEGNCKGKTLTSGVEVYLKPVEKQACDHTEDQ